MANESNKMENVGFAVNTICSFHKALDLIFHTLPDYPLLLLNAVIALVMIIISRKSYISGIDDYKQKNQFVH